MGKRFGSFVLAIFATGVIACGSLNSTAASAGHDGQGLASGDAFITADQSYGAQRAIAIDGAGQGAANDAPDGSMLTP